MFLKENENKNKEIKPSIQERINDEKMKKGKHTNTAKPIKWHSLTHKFARGHTHART